MKKILLFTCMITILMSGAFKLSGQVSVSIDNSQADPSAGLDVNFNNKGLLPPRMTRAEMNAIVNPASGLIVYCTDCGSSGTGAMAMFINGEWSAIYSTPCNISAPVAGIHIPSSTQIIWNWNAVSGAIGYKWNTTNNYNTAVDLGAVTTKTETGLACNTPFIRYVWGYNSCGASLEAPLTQSTPECVPTNGLMGYWPFNGNPNDESGLENNGIVVGGAYLTTNRFGVSNSAYYCPVGCYIDVPNYNWSYPEISFSGWFKSITGARIFQHEFCTPNGIWLIITPDPNTLEAIFGKCNSTQIPIFSYINTLDGQWHHVVITKSSTSAKMYIDAVLTASYDSPFTLNNSNGHLYFGSPEMTYNTYTGSVDDERIYNRALTSDEISLLYHEGGWQK